MLSRERLHRIQRLLARHDGALSIRDFERSYGVHRWEIEEAEALGWLVIETQKPRTGRPSRMVREVSKPCSAKLPPWRTEIEKPISFRHWRFVVESLLAVKRGSHRVFALQTMTDAYQSAFPNARKRRAASASVCRLLKTPGVRALRAWYRAQVVGKIAIGVSPPATVSEIKQRLAVY